MKDAIRRRFDVLAVRSIDRLGRSTATVAGALAELDAAGVAIYADREGMDATTPHGRAMLQMAAVFAELEHGMSRERVIVGLVRAKEAGRQLGRPKTAASVETAIKKRLAAGAGIIKVAREVGVGNGTVARVKAAMATAG
jgi:DNA invertase Pin-like site-specific DNA recombinase